VRSTSNLFIIHVLPDHEPFLVVYFDNMLELSSVSAGMRCRGTRNGSGIDICWLEAVAFESCFLFIEQLAFKDIYVLVRSDNKGAIGALTKG
jgi:hypothetical protein